MNSPSTDETMRNQTLLVGVQPWLPWPLSAWNWWTRPVPAERLAILRTGLCLCLIFDLWFTYRPKLHVFFGAGGLGDPDLFAWYGQAPRWNWSLLRGLGDPLLFTLAIIGWTIATSWIVVVLIANFTGDAAAPDKPRRWKVIVAWLAASILFGLCVWARVLPSDGESESWVQMILGSWQRRPEALRAAFWIWFGAALGLLFGIATRIMAITAWIFSISFAHLNPYIDNAGDVVRGIILFYLMLCPCGAAWSFDSCIRRLRHRDQRVAFVSPWPLRLLFVQMTLIYFVNGLFKIFGETWRSGDSLYLVLGDLNLIRFPHDRIYLPYFLSIAMTWFMLIWEVGFPFWIALPWTRVAALIFGALFHIGIFLTMELGGFAPYMLTLYLPLLPLKRWREQDRTL